MSNRQPILPPAPIAISESQDMAGAIFIFSEALFDLPGGIIKLDANIAGSVWMCRQ